MRDNQNYAILFRFWESLQNFGHKIPKFGNFQKEFYRFLHNNLPIFQGIIKLSSADSILCEEIVRDKFNSIDWSTFDTKNLFVYPRSGGEVR